MDVAPGEPCSQVGVLHQDEGAEGRVHHLFRKARCYPWHESTKRPRDSLCIGITISHVVQCREG